MKKTNLKIIGIFLAIFIFVIFIGLNFRGGINKTDVKAASTDNVSGYAWSENIGWISFNCTNSTPPCSATNYGVNLNFGTGNLSGYAWAGGGVDADGITMKSTVGWIRFDAPPDFTTGLYPACPISTCPGGSPNYSSKLDSVTGRVTGWARACAGTVGGDCISLTRIDGLDGWILLGPIVKSGTDYGVSKNGSDFTGWAWGSDVVGWVSFNRKNCDTDGDGFSNGGVGCPAVGTPIANYKVYLANTPPAAINLAATPPDYCSSGPSAILSWTFSDPDSGSSQTAYQVQIATDAGFTTITKDTGKLLSSSGSYATPAGTLVYNQTYYWRVMVWDNYDAPSVWANGPNFSTPVHAYPTANFTYLPANPLVGQEITFTDASTAFGGATITTRNWDFCKGATCPNKTATGTPVTHTYAVKNNYTVELTVKDSDNFTCSTTKALNLTKSLLSPGWKEVIPK